MVIHFVQGLLHKSCTHLLCIVDELLELFVYGLEQPLSLLILALETGEHQGQEGLVAQQGDAAM